MIAIFESINGASGHSKNVHSISRKVKKRQNVWRNLIWQDVSIADRQALTDLAYWILKNTLVQHMLLLWQLEQTRQEVQKTHEVELELHE